MQKIKLAMIVNDLNLNGISNVVMSYCKEIDKDKFSVYILAGAPISETHRQDADNCLINICDLPSRKKQSLQYYLSLWKVLKQEKFNIVHVHGNSATMVVELLWAWLSGVQVRIAHGHSSTCSNISIHKLLYPFFSLLYTDGFACSEIAGRWLFHNKYFTIIPNGFYTSDFKFNEKKRDVIRKQLNIKSSDFVVGHVGRFNSPKNHDFILKIFEKVAEANSNAWLLLVGDGPDFDRINNLIARHRYKNRIIVYGETKNTVDLYAAMDVFVFPSKFEGLGIVTLEAQISGLPVIASDRVPKEVNICNQVKFLPLDDDVQKWALTVLNVKTIDRTEVYKKNQNKIEAYDITNNVKQLERLYVDQMNRS